MWVESLEIGNGLLLGFEEDCWDGLDTEAGGEGRVDLDTFSTTISDFRGDGLPERDDLGVYPLSCLLEFSFDLVGVATLLLLSLVSLGVPGSSVLALGPSNAS